MPNLFLTIYLVCLKNEFCLEGFYVFLVFSAFKSPFTIPHNFASQPLDNRMAWNLLIKGGFEVLYIRRNISLDNKFTDFAQFYLQFMIRNFYW